MVASWGCKQCPKVVNAKGSSSSGKQNLLLPKGHLAWESEKAGSACSYGHFISSDSYVGSCLTISFKHGIAAAEPVLSYLC